MKRCQSKGITRIVLILASLFIFPSCGIPTYFYLDESEFITTSQSDTVDNQINLEISLSDSALVKISDKSVVDGPGLKFFYALSKNPTTYIVDGVTQRSTVETSFNTNFKGSAGNGLLWSPGYSNAPGFYLYTNDSAKTNVFSLHRPDEFTDCLLIGTFAMSEFGSNAYEFRKAPAMDISLENLPNLNPSTMNLSIRKGGVEDPEGFTDLLIELDSGDLDLQSYKMETFPTTVDTLRERIAEDSEFLSYLENAQDLYIHIWVALYCSEGAFSNIFWSNLRYAGYIELL